MTFPTEASNRLIRKLRADNPLIIGPLSQELQNGYVLAADTVENSKSIILVSATGFVAGSLIIIEEVVNGIPETFYAEVLSVSVNTLTLDRPVDTVFTVNSQITRENFDLSVDGSTTFYGCHNSAPLQIDQLFISLA